MHHTHARMHACMHARTHACMRAHTHAFLSNSGTEANCLWSAIPQSCITCQHLARGQCRVTTISDLTRTALAGQVCTLLISDLIRPRLRHWDSQTKVTRPLDICLYLFIFYEVGKWIIKSAFFFLFSFFFFLFFFFLVTFEEAA